MIFFLTLKHRQKSGDDRGITNQFFFSSWELEVLNPVLHAGETN